MPNLRWAGECSRQLDIIQVSTLAIKAQAEDDGEDVIVVFASREAVHRRCDEGQCRETGKRRKNISRRGCMDKESGGLAAGRAEELRREVTVCWLYMPKPNDNECADNVRIHSVCRKLLFTQAKVQRGEFQS